MSSIDWNEFVDYGMHNGKSIAELMEDAYQKGKQESETEKFVAENEAYICGYSAGYKAQSELYNKQEKIVDDEKTKKQKSLFRRILSWVEQLYKRYTAYFKRN